MDIYEYAKEFNADYMDKSKGLIYKVQEYNDKIIRGLPTDGIKVYTLEGEFVGVAEKI